MLNKKICIQRSVFKIKVVIKEIFTLLQKDFTIDFRQKYALGGILLYVSSSVFVVFLSFIKAEPVVWNTLFWTLSLFASINALTKSFMQENSNRQLYYYQIANPTAVLISKIIYGFLNLIIINLLTWLTLSLMLNSPVKDNGIYLMTVILGSLSFSITFTFIAAIAVKAQNAATMMAILSFPVILPILILLINLSKNALRLSSDSAWAKDIAMLLGIDAILLALCLVLFPVLWKE